MVHLLDDSADGRNNRLPMATRAHGVIGASREDQRIDIRPLAHVYEELRLRIERKAELTDVGDDADDLPGLLEIADKHRLADWIAVREVASGQRFVDQHHTRPACTVTLDEATTGQHANPHCFEVVTAHETDVRQIGRWLVAGGQTPDEASGAIRAETSSPD